MGGSEAQRQAGGPGGAWTYTGPTQISGRIKSLAIDQTDGEIVYAGAANGGVWKTVDGGDHWLSSYTDALPQAIGCIGIAASRPTTLYVGTGEDAPGWSATFAGAGVFRTDDSGNSWYPLAPFPSERCSRLIVHPEDPDTVFVGAETGLYKWTRGGGWRTMIEGHVSDLALDPTSPETLFVGIWERGIYKSNNRGEDWIALTNGLPYGPSAGWIKIGMGLRGQYGTQFLLAKMGSPQEFLYRTTDSGQTWNPVWRAPIPPSDPTWASVVSVSPDDESLFFYGGDVLFPPRGSDVGKNPIPDIHLDCHAVAFAPSRAGLCYAATDGGVFRSENIGHSWSAVNNGLQTVQFYSVGVSRSSTLRIGGATHDVGILQSRDGGDWQNAHAGSERGFYIVDPRDDRNVFVFPDSRLERSADGGVTWKMILTGIDKGGGTEFQITHLAVAPDNSRRLLCLLANRVYYSVDQGENWHPSLEIDANPTRVAFSESDPYRSFVATDSGRVYRSSSAEAGDWKEPYDPIDRPPKGNVTALAVHPSDSELLYIGYSDAPGVSLLKSSDGGRHWQPATGTGQIESLPAAAARSIVIDPSHSNTLYVATEVGVYVSHDGGATWNQFSAGLPFMGVSELALHQPTNTLYASTMGRGMYKRLL